MQWIPLRKYNVHLVDNQIERAIKQYYQVCQSILGGDILAVSKKKDLQFSMKKRLDDIDKFYNSNCSDIRVRYLQGPRMKIFRLLSQFGSNNEKQGAENSFLPSHRANDEARSRRDGLTPKRTTTPKRNQKSDNKTPINKLIGTQKQISSKKPNIYLQIPQQPSNPNFSFSGEEIGRHKYGDKTPQVRKSRKMEFIPSKKDKEKIKQEKQKDRDDKSLEKKGKKTSPSPISEKSKQSLNIGKNRNISESNSSMKKLNDLIFTIKMTKEEYQEFVQIKRNLQRR